MAQTFDVILKSGTVVYQDGEGVRDIGMIGGRNAEIGSLGGARAGEVISYAAGPAVAGTGPSRTLPPSCPPTSRHMPSTARAA